MKSMESMESITSIVCRQIHKRFPSCKHLSTKTIRSVCDQSGDEHMRMLRLAGHFTSGSILRTWVPMMMDFLGGQSTTAKAKVIETSI